MSRASRIVERLRNAGISFTRDGENYWLVSDGKDTHVFTTAQIEAFLVAVERFAQP